MAISEFLRNRYLRKLYSQGYQDGVGRAARKMDRKAYLAGRDAAESGKSYDLGWSDFQDEINDEDFEDDVSDEEIEEDMDEDEDNYLDDDGEDESIDNDDDDEETDSCDDDEMEE